MAAAPFAAVGGARWQTSVTLAADHLLAIIFLMKMVDSEVKEIRFLHPQSHIFYSLQQDPVVSKVQKIMFPLPQSVILANTTE